MTTRQLRGRLDRLTQSANNTRTEGKRERPFEFTIDPALAKALQDDIERLDEIQSSNWFTRDRGAPETEEERTLRVRISEKASAIDCPAYYGFRERWDDSARLSRLGPNGFSTGIPPFFVPEVPYYDVEDVDAERTQLTARIAAFDHSPEGRTRARIQDLMKKGSGWMSAADHNELDRLITLYPEPWSHPEATVMKSLAMVGMSPEDRRRAAERDQRAVDKEKLYRSRPK